MCLVTGCASNPETRENLSAGFSGIQNASHNDDLADPLRRADAELQKQPHGPNSAEALYLRGRALEQRAKRDRAAAIADLAQARNAYTEALALSPPAPLDSFLRASLGNVCYWQDDYVAAQQHWSAAQGKFSDDSTNAYILYRIGLCQQRLGNFSAADQTFAETAKQYSSTEAAQRAKMKTGYRAFTVQLATFATAAPANTAASQLRREGMNPSIASDAAGRSVVSIGPATTYGQAMQMKSRYAGRFPDAVILP